VTRFSLEIIEGPQRGMTLPLREGDLVVGRSPRCSIVLPDVQVSPTHCGLRVAADQVLIAPGGTVSPTAVNDEPLTKARVLRVGDVIRVGTYRLVLRVSLPSKERRFYAGDEVGGYRLLSELGTGAVGRVHAAQAGDQRVVALKVLRLHSDWTLREEQHRRALFRREAEVLAAISHPNVVRLYAAGEHQGVPWLAMELLQGNTLRDKLAAGRLPVREIERLIFQLCAGVAACHAAGMIHRDLKPANVMLVGADERVVLADFGLAQPQGAPRMDELDPARDGAVIRVGRQIGTPAYMAPEQTLGAEADLRSDVWSLGAMLYELAAGRRPFPGQDVRAVLSAVVRAGPAPLPDDVAPHLRGAVYRCLQKKPDWRFANAVELVEAIHDKKVTQWLPAGADGPEPTDLEGCPVCRAPIQHPVRCLRCGAAIFRYTDGQVFTVRDEQGHIQLACGRCGVAVTHEAQRCPCCTREFTELPPEGLARSAPVLTAVRAVVVDIFDQALALLDRCPYCNAVREKREAGRCRECGFVVRAYVTSRLALELAMHGWDIRCGHCHAVVPNADEGYCPQCGLNFTNGQRPDGTRFDDVVPPQLRRRLEKGERG